MTGDIMKRAELIIGKTYFMSESANWRDKHSGAESYFKTAQRNRWRKVTIIETQLKTEHQKMYRTRDVLIQNCEGNEKWVPLNHIRTEWAYAIGLMTEDYRRRYYSPDEGRGLKYQRHLAKKHLKEQHEPAMKALCQEIERVTGERVWSHDTIGGLELKTIQILNQALSVIKTELTAVAS
jgi:hypothetical protein